MFTYNTRTELLPNGTKFIEKDIILFDYSYTGDIVFQVDAVLKTPGFGFVIQEDDGDEQNAENIVLISFSTDDSYKVITKTGGEQVTAAYQFVEAATHVYGDTTTLFFKKHNEVLTVYKGIRMEDGHYEELKLMTYRMAYDMDHYWIGIYSNGGNLVKFASVKTEAPSNWISNVINAGGGRIQWIKNGFTIDEAKYDIEVEAIDVLIAKGRYWFDYQTDNPDMKAYVYQTYRKGTKDEDRRNRKEIEATMTDEAKNLVKDDGSFVLTEDCHINIKFKGKWGTVTNISIKNDKQADFVETEYGTTMRPGSRLKFDLDKIKKIKLAGTLYSVPTVDPGEHRTYSIFRRGTQDLALEDPLTLNRPFVLEFTEDTGKIYLDGEFYRTLDDPSRILYAFDNVTANITEFKVTPVGEDEEVNILIQKTIKLAVPTTVQSPILVVGEDEEPLDLSASYRKLAVVKPQLEVFNTNNKIALQHIPYTVNPDIKLYGIPYTTYIDDKGKPKSVIHKEADTIEDMADIYEEIQYVPNPALELKGIIKLPQEIKDEYPYVIIAYNGIVDYRYIFTNQEREIYDLKKDPRIYLSSAPLNITTDLYVYGIADPDYFNEDLLYYIPDNDFTNSIDISAYSYDELVLGEDFRINTVNKVILDNKLTEKYKYLIIDYLKKDSYAINEKDGNYYIDIATEQVKVNVSYDAREDDGKTTQVYKTLTVGDISNGDFVALELKE